jgi:hypothetical protein
MKIELKNIKRAAFASQETHCFQAVLYVNGKPFATIRNAGFGGGDDVEPIKGDYTEEFCSVLKEVSAHVKTICKEEYANLEYWCALQVNDFVLAKQFQRDLKKKVLGVLPDGKLYSWQLKEVSLERLISSVKSVRPEVVILNEMSYNESFKLFKQAMAV